MRRNRSDSPRRATAPRTTDEAPTAAVVPMKRRRSQPEGTRDSRGRWASNQLVRVRSNSGIAASDPTSAPTTGAMTDQAFEPGRSAAASAPTTAKATMPIDIGRMWRRLATPRAIEVPARTMTMPTRKAVLSLVPNQSMANSFNQRGVRSMNELPTASMGEGRSASEATIIPEVTAMAPLASPATAAAQRGSPAMRHQDPDDGVPRGRSRWRSRRRSRPDSAVNASGPPDRAISERRSGRNRASRGRCTTGVGD